MDEVDDEPLYVRAVLAEKQNTVKFTSTEKTTDPDHDYLNCVLTRTSPKSIAARDYFSTNSMLLRPTVLIKVTTNCFNCHRTRGYGINYSRTPSYPTLMGPGRGRNTKKPR